MNPIWRCDLNIIKAGGNPDGWLASFVGETNSKDGFERTILDRWRDVYGRQCLPDDIEKLGGDSDGAILRGAGSWRHVEQVVTHPVMGLFFLQGMVMHHDHFVVVLLGNWEPNLAFIHLVRGEFTESPVYINIWNGS